MLAFRLARHLRWRRSHVIVIHVTVAYLCNHHISLYIVFFLIANKYIKKNVWRPGFPGDLRRRCCPTKVSWYRISHCVKSTILKWNKICNLSVTTIFLFCCFKCLLLVSTWLSHHQANICGKLKTLLTVLIT